MTDVMQMFQTKYQLQVRATQNKRSYCVPFIEEMDHQSTKKLIQVKLIDFSFIIILRMEFGNLPKNYQPMGNFTKITSTTNTGILSGNNNNNNNWQQQQLATTTTTTTTILSAAQTLEQC